MELFSLHAEELKIHIWTNIASACLLVPWEAKVGEIPWNWLADWEKSPLSCRLHRFPHSVANRQFWQQKSESRNLKREKNESESDHFWTVLVWEFLKTGGKGGEEPPKLQITSVPVPTLLRRTWEHILKQKCKKRNGPPFERQRISFCFPRPWVLLLNFCS